MTVSLRATARLSGAALALVLAGCATTPPAPVTTNIVAINDFHGNLEPSRYVPANADGGKAQLPFDAIADAKLTITDRLLAATAPLSSEGAEEFEEASDSMRRLLEQC